MLKNLDSINFLNKKILLRIDINSPIVKGIPLDNERFLEHASTINELLNKGAKIVIIAHQGRKNGKDYIPSLKKHAEILSKYTKKEIIYINDLFENKSKNAILSLKSGNAILLKNVRSYDDENISKSNNYKELCSLFDVYVNDAFSVCHRKQGSIILPPRYLPSFIGKSIEKELSALKHISLKGDKPTILLLGGEKFEDYFPLFDLLKNKNIKIASSGILGNAFLIAKGFNLGYEQKWMDKNGYLKNINKLKSLIKKYNNQIIFPCDFAFGDKKREEIKLSMMPFDKKILDVGHDTISQFQEEILKSKIVFMKGPLGFSEITAFSYATTTILKTISRLTKNNSIYSIIGGGHLATSIKKYNIPKNFSHISLSGGALIKALSGEKLPGLEALKIK